MTCKGGPLFLAWYGYAEHAITTQILWSQVARWSQHLDRLRCIIALEWGSINRTNWCTAMKVELVGSNAVPATPLWRMPVADRIGWAEHQCSINILGIYFPNGILKHGSGCKVSHHAGDWAAVIKSWLEGWHGVIVRIQTANEAAICRPGHDLMPYLH